MSTPVAQTLFLGASISRFDVNIGWGSQPTTLTVNLVEDTFTTTTKSYWSARTGNSPLIYTEEQFTTAADTFSPPDVGSPVYFRIGNFSFSGLLQGWVQEESTGGKPTYTVEVVSPNAILAGVQLITGGYSGSVQGMTNVLNCFGYWENTAYGASLYNEAGMPWERVKTAIENITASSTVGTYGGAVTWNSIKYSIDLANLPDMPDFYRGNGSNYTNLLDFVDTLCKDASYDFIVDMYFSGNAPVIRIKTVSRRTQPNTGLLNAYLLSLTGVSQKSRGLEARSEPVKAFIVGGTVEQIDTESYNGLTGSGASIWPYWGERRYFSDGDWHTGVIIGTGINDLHKFTIDLPYEVHPTRSTYDVTVGELRAAKVGIEAWQDYVSAIDADKREAWKIEPRLDPSLWANTVDNEVKNVAPPNQPKAKSDQENELSDQERLQRLYDLIKTYAEDYYGRKFMVQVNNLDAKIESETGRFIYSLEPIDAGYLPRSKWSTATTPLDLPATGWIMEQFTTPDYRFKCYASFNNRRLDHEVETPTNGPTENVLDLTSLGDRRLWVTAGADPNFVFVRDSGFLGPRVVVTLDEPIYKATATGTNGHELDESFDLLRILYNIGNNLPVTGVLSDEVYDTIVLARNEPNSKNFGFSKAAIMPTGVAVPLRYDKETYGPWATGTYDGQVKFEQDPSLVPWNYNGYDFLDVAASAKIAESLSTMASTETGTVELPGVPSIGIGDALVSGGPSVTNMSVSVGVDGVKTFYRMQTYTPTFGAMAKHTVETIGRIVSAQDQIRKNAGFAAKHHLGRPVTSRLVSPVRGKSNAGKSQFSPKSPHSVLVGQLQDLGNGKTAILASTAKNEEAVTVLGETTYPYSAVLSLDNFLAPYSTNLAGTTGFPHFEVPHSGFLNTNTSISLNPYWGGPSGYKNTSISGYPNTSMITSSGTHPASGLSPNVTHGFYAQNVRGVGLKGPLVLTSWGYGIDGKMWPSGQTDRFMDHEFKQKPHMWKSGPVDLWWDDYRKVWTGTAMYKAVSNGNGTYRIGITDNANHNVELERGVTITPTEWIGGGYVPSGNRAIIASVQGQLLVISAEC